MSFIKWKDGKGFFNQDQSISESSIYYVDIPKRTSQLINDVPFLTVQDSVSSNIGSVISGGEIVWVEDYKYISKPVKINIGGKNYGPSIQREITIEDGGAQNRKDLVLGTFNPDTGSCYVRIEKGQESANPQEPNYNRSTEVRLTVIDVDAGTTQPSGINTVVVYNENAEYTTTSSIIGGGSVDFDSTSNPLRDAKCISVSNFKSGDSIAFESTLFNPLDNSLLEFYILNESGDFWENTGSIEIVFFNGATEVSQPVVISSHNDGVNPYFFNGDRSVWQNITIPINAFQFSVDQATKIVFRKVDEMDVAGDSFKLDLIRFQSGTPIVSGVTKTRLSEFINDLDVVSPLTTKGDIYIYDTSSDRLPIGVNGQVLTVNASGLPEWSNPVTGVTDHVLLSNIGTNTHAEIDTHITNGSYHVTVNGAPDAGKVLTASATPGVFTWEENVAGSNLESVTSAGNTTTKSIIIDDIADAGKTFEVKGLGHLSGLYVNSKGALTAYRGTKYIDLNSTYHPDGTIVFGNSTNELELNSLHTTTSRVQSFQDKDGTIALLSDITGSVSPLTTKGDIYIYDTADDRLPIGVNGQVLTVNALGLPEWSNPVTGVTDHTLLSNIGVNTHLEIDTHINSGSYHVTVNGAPDAGKVLTASATPGTFTWETNPVGVTDHVLLSNIGTNTHAEIDTHIADTTKHYLMSSISITESQISDFGTYNNYIHPTNGAQGSVNNSGRTYIQDIIIDANGHITGIVSATESVVNTDTNRLTTFYAQDGDGTNVLMSQGKYMKFVEATGSGATVNINWTDTSTGSVSDPYDLSFSVTNTDKGSSQSIFKNVAVSGQSTIVADNNNDTLTFVAGTNITLTTNSTGDSITINSVAGGGGAVDSVSGSGAITVSPTTGAVAVTHSTLAGYKHIPTGGSTNQVLKYSASGTASWATLPTVNSVAFAGASIIVEPYSEAVATASSHYVTFVDSSVSGYNRIKKDAGITYNPSTNALVVTGNITANDFIGSSDERLKENITLVLPGHEITSNYREFNFKGNDQLRVGVIAQELELFHPEFVRTNDKGMKSVSYQDLHSAEIANLKNEIKELKKLIHNLL